MKYNDVLQQLTGPAMTVKARLETQDQLAINQDSHQPSLTADGYISYQPPGKYKSYAAFIPFPFYHLIVESFQKCTYSFLL